MPRRGAAGSGPKLCMNQVDAAFWFRTYTTSRAATPRAGPHARVRDAQVALDVLAQPAERGRARELPQARGLRRLIKGRVAPREADAVPEGRVGVCEAAWPPVVPVDHGRRARAELRGREGACGARRASRVSAASDAVALLAVDPAVVGSSGAQVFRPPATPRASPLCFARAGTTTTLENAAATRSM